MSDIDKVKNEYKQSSQKLSPSEPVFDWTESGKLLKRKKFLGKIIEKEKEISKIKIQIQEDESIIAKSKDQELTILAQEELKNLQKKEAGLRIELKNLVTESKKENSKPLKAKSVIVEIRAGAGGEEAALFAGDLFRMYSRYGQLQGWQQKILDSHPTELGGFKEIIFEMKPASPAPASPRGEKRGENGDVFSKMKFEAGVHRVQRIPHTEKRGRIHTSTASVAVLPQFQKTQTKIKPSDLRIETFRASGPGGQYVNRRETAIRITHLPTGIVATCQIERSQERNKLHALSILKARISEKRRKELEKSIKGKRRTQIGKAKRSEKIRTYNFPQDRVTDHRVKKSWHNIEAIMAGKLDSIIKTLRKKEK